MAGRFRRSHPIVCGARVATGSAFHLNRFKLPLYLKRRAETTKPAPGRARSGSPLCLPQGNQLHRQRDVVRNFHPQ